MEDFPATLHVNNWASISIHDLSRTHHQVGVWFDLIVFILDCIVLVKVKESDVVSNQNLVQASYFYGSDLSGETNLDSSHAFQREIFLFVKVFLKSM